MKYGINHHWSYGENLSGQPGAWNVKNVFLCEFNHKFTVKTISKTGLVFSIGFKVYELGHIFIYLRPGESYQYENLKYIFCRQFCNIDS